MLTRAHRPAFSWDRSAVLLGVIGLHVGGFFLISVYGGFGRLVETTAQALKVLTLPDEPQRVVEPPPAHVQLQQPSRFEPQAPDRVVDVVDDPPGGTSIGVRADDGTGRDDRQGGEGLRLPAIPATALTYRQRRPPDDYYPANSIRMEEEGAAIVRVCVDARGALQGVPQVTDGSGHARLDAAAIVWAREALTFTPATENGVPVASCKGFRVRFTLRK